MMNAFLALSEAAATAVPEVADNAAKAASSLAELPLMSKGLLTMGIGLAGVFLVLTLYFLTIKLMQRIKTKQQ